MFNNLSKKFIKIIQNISGYGRITKQDIQKTLREIRKILLEADVSLLIIKTLIKNIEVKIIGKNINSSLTPGQEVIKILKEELLSIIENQNSNINLSVVSPAVILMIGLQGSGKTTSVIKLGKFIYKNYKKKVLVASTDIYRPAAIKQLKILSQNSKIDFFESQNTNNTIIISKECIKYAKKKLYDVLILDTAGRLHTNENMMEEIYNIKNIIQPIETFFVIDAMMGQESINIADHFNNSINITGLILTKIDSDTRGGSALSASYITKKPIKFIGTGEKIESFEIFNAKKIVSRILGMHNTLSIIENIEKKIGKKNIQKIKEKIKKNHKFNFYDFKMQMQQMEKLGGISNILSKFPIGNSNLKNFTHQNHKNYLSKIEAIINSMTPFERMHPEIIKGSRKKRIACGSGTNIQDINKLLKQFNELKKMMKKIKKNGIQKTIQYFKSMIPNVF